MNFSKKQNKASRDSGHQFCWSKNANAYWCHFSGGMAEMLLALIWGSRMQKNKKLRVFLKWGLFFSKNQNVFNPVWTPGIMITIIVWDTLWIFQKCYSPQSRVINSLTRGSRLARPLTGLSTNAKSFIRCCKDKPIARGGPIKFRSPFWKEKKSSDESSTTRTILMKSILLMYPNGC